MTLVGSSVWTDCFRNRPTPQDVLIATRCLADGLQLLHSDRDFEPFEKHLRLRAVQCQV